MLSSNYSKPRILVKTNTCFSYDNNTGYRTYGNPQALAQSLYSEQGTADENYKGTCGLCSVANILRLSGVVDADEKMILDFYKKRLALPFFLIGIVPLLKLSEKRKPPEKRGGTEYWQLKYILHHFGIKCILLSPTPYHKKYMTDDRLKSLDKENAEKIARFIEEGHGVLISIDYERYKQKYSAGSAHPSHAFAITSVTRDNLGQIQCFYIHDPDGHSHPEKNPVKLNLETFNSLLISKKKIIVTKPIIR